jgi:hypothetical protein
MPIPIQLTDSEASLLPRLLKAEWAMPHSCLTKR